MSNDEIQVLLHTLGINIDSPGGYRNHFVAGDGHHSEAALIALCTSGLMEERQRPLFIGSTDRLYVATAKGKRIAETLRPKPRRTRSQRRYDRYLRVADLMTFREFIKQEASK